jgi:hypothetical protein
MANSFEDAFTALTDKQRSEADAAERGAAQRAADNTRD